MTSLPREVWTDHTKIWTPSPSIGKALAARQRGQSEAVKEIAWKAQHRLFHRYRKLMAAGKTKQQVVTAIGRELLGFIWAIGVHVERAASPRLMAAP
jgi:transposase